MLLKDTLHLTKQDLSTKRYVQKYSSCRNIGETPFDVRKTFEEKDKLVLKLLII